MPVLLLNTRATAASDYSVANSHGISVILTDFTGHRPETHDSQVILNISQILGERPSLKVHPRPKRGVEGFGPGTSQCADNQRYRDNSASGQVGLVPTRPPV